MDWVAAFFLRRFAKGTPLLHFTFLLRLGYNGNKKCEVKAMAFCFGENVRYRLFGQGDSEYIGMVIEGLPAGEYIDPYDVREFVGRCSSEKKTSSFGGGSSREVQFLSGVMEYRTCGTPVCAVMANDSGVSEPTETEAEGLLPPSEFEILRWLQGGAGAALENGDIWNERILAALCIGGVIAKKLLEKRDIVVGAHIESIGSIHDRPFDPVRVTPEELKDPGRYPFPTLNYSVGETMQAQIDLTAKRGDSIGGVVECGITGLPGGLGDSLFHGLSGALAANLFALPGVAGVEFGDGFRSAMQKGSGQKTALRGKDGRLCTEKNGCGGVLWGVSTGMPLILRVAMRPSMEIPGEWETFDPVGGEEAMLTTKRHQPCFVPQMVPVVESVLAMTLLDRIMVK